MEEIKNPAPVGGAEAGNNGEHRRRRGHRGGKKHNKHRAENGAAQVQNNNANPGEQKAQSQKPKEARQADSAANNEQKKNDPKKNNRNKKNRDRKGNAHSRDRIPQKDDIYGDPNEERELAEWRAKIVLNSSASPAPLQRSAPPTEAADEDVAIPEGTDLFESPVMASAPKSEGEQVEVVGVRFRSVGKMYYFSPNGLKVKKGDYAIVETARGPEFGDVCLGNTMIAAEKTVSPLRPLIRVATKEDVAHNEENRQKEKEALGICQKKIAEHKLDMKLIEVQYAFDNSKLLFYFSSEGRVDFRELVKDLASVFRTRIELRQIGIRDEAKLLGGFGACGRTLCCSTFLPDFAQVSIKMAKEQGLSLNSTKISGLCGRLMCCLRFESDVYAAEHKLTPSVNSTVKTEDGIGTVISTNPLAGTVRVIFKDSPDTPPKQYHRSTVTVLPKEKPRQDTESTQKGE